MPWKTISGWNVLEQAQEQSCGYCCVGMTVSLLEGGSGKRSESGLVAEGRRIGGTGEYDRHAKDRVGAKATPLVAAAEEQLGQLPHWGSGTYGSHLADLLRQGYHVNATYHGGQSTATMKSAMRSVGGGQYMIVLVQWSGGGGHWVLVVGRAGRGLGSASNYTILDPGGDVVVNRGSTSYRAANGATGTFAGYYVMIRGRTQMASKATGVKVM